MKSPIISNKKRVYIFALLFVVLILAPVLLNTYYNFLLKPVSPKINETQIFVIQPGTPVVTIAQNLKEEELIKNTLAFRLLIAQLRIGTNIQAGDFRLSPSMSSRDIAKELTHGAIDVWITLPEGLRIEEQAEILDNKLNAASSETTIFDKTEYISTAQEGYMFPDTYLIPKDATTKDIVDLLRNTFNEKVDPSIFSEGRKNGLTETQLVTLASLIEKEAKSGEEKLVIAGIIMNRISSGTPLQIDATVRYAKGFDKISQTWWSSITQLDYQQVRSPYNTYLSQGLPLGPIASPGLDSLIAAANPANTEYRYYLHDSNGNIHYAKTIEEHNRNAREFIF